MTVLPTRRPTRRGSIVPLLAVCVIGLFAFIALAIDLGMMMVSRTECQNAADAAALAGVRTLDNRVPAGQTEDQYDNQAGAASTNARTAITNNVFLNRNYTNAQITDVTVGLYDYDTSTQSFAPNFTYATKPVGKAWSAVQVTVDGTQPTYFGKVLGITSMPMSAYAVAAHRPRDIALVLDYTGSMGYASTFTYRYYDSASNSYWCTYNSSDTSYPQFGQYSRYLAYQNTNPNNDPAGSTIANRPNPLYQTGTVIAAPYVYSPANFTNTTANGPPIVSDFLFDPANAASPTTAVTSVNSANLANAFTATTFDTTASARSFSGHGPTPAPDNFKDQSDTPTAYVGDKWPRKGGAATGTTWSVTDPNGAAVNAAELLGWNTGGKFTSSSTTSNWPGSPPSRTLMTPSVSYSNASSPTNYGWGSFRDATWETYGYDMDVANYIASRAASVNWDPRNVMPANSGQGVTPGKVLVTPGKFVGYSMGPGYWGKTFFIWPPDPRSSWDWRRKFFLNRTGNALDPQADNDSSTTGTQAINEELFTNGTGLTLTNSSGNWQPNYSAILTWIKSGPQVLPPNLRAGRVLYYSSIPSDVNTATGTADQVKDKQFWKAYINYVLTGAVDLSTGINYTLADFENVGWPENTAAFAPGRLAGASMGGYKGSATATADPLPYMAYTDNPSRPRMHLWFGPVTMLSFLSTKAMLSGTTHQAQCWQLKAGVNSALDDIKANHPNDMVGLTFFSYTDYHDPMVSMGQDWNDLKNALFFPKTLLATIQSSNTVETRPYDSSLNYTGRGDVPNAQGSTDPNTGLTTAFNLLAPSHYPASNTDPSRRGRRGASKIVIFETDGVPNATQGWTLNKFGYETYYNWIGGTDSAGANQAAYNVVDQMVKPMSVTNTSGTDSGLSLPSAPCRVYAIGFGDIFSTTAGPTAANFLLTIQQKGNTSAPTDTSIPSYQIITGAYDTRISNLRTALERICQSGVQVTLIE